MKKLLPQLAASLFLLTACFAQAAEKRVALVMGNGAYQNLPKLDNPTHDAADMAAALGRFGFEVILRENQTLEGMNEAIAEFGRKLGGSDVALFFFAGHGIQVKSQNYIIPVNAKIESEAGVAYQGVNINQVLDELDISQSRANILILDACRDNPISGKFRSSGSRGLAAPASTPKGTVIVYATDPGNTAMDGSGRNGLLTAGLLTAFKGEDLSLDAVLTVASAEVERISNQKQTPYVNGPKTLQKNLRFGVPVDSGPALGQAEIEKDFWVGIKDSTDPADFKAYLQEYPSGRYRALALNRLKRLKASQTADAPVPQPDPAVQEQKAWEIAERLQTLEGYQAYLSDYPNGQHAKYAKASLAKLGKDEPRQVQTTAAVAASPPMAQVGTAVAVASETRQSFEPALVRVKGGTFQMGSPDTEPDRVSDERQHAVTVQDFAIGATEVTQAQWRAVMGNNPSANKDCDDCPVEQVSWNEVQEYIDKLNAKAGKTYRLPTEAEWEYACRSGGKAELYCGGADLDQLAWYGTNSEGKSHPGGQKTPNGLGLYDMSGNVWEWSCSAYAKDYDGSETRCRGKNLAGQVANRGGAWGNNPLNARAAARFWNSPTYRHFYLGFRLAQD